MNGILHLSTEISILQRNIYFILCFTCPNIIFRDKTKKSLELLNQFKHDSNFNLLESGRMLLEFVTL